MYLMSQLRAESLSLQLQSLDSMPWCSKLLQYGSIHDHGPSKMAQLPVPHQSYTEIYSFLVWHLVVSIAMTYSSICRISNHLTLLPSCCSDISWRGFFFSPMVPWVCHRQSVGYHSNVSRIQVLAVEYNILSTHYQICNWWGFFHLYHMEMLLPTRLYLILCRILCRFIEVFTFTNFNYLFFI